MNKKAFNLMFLLILPVFLIGFMNAQDYEVHKINESFSFSITSNFASECNLTTINNPNGYTNINQEGDKNSQTFSFSIDAGNYSDVGQYCHQIECTDGSEIVTASKCIIVNRQGFYIQEGSGTMYSISLFVLLVLFIISLYYAITLPFKNQRNDSGTMLFVDYKKYLKIFMAFISYLLLTFIFAIGKGMSYAFLSSTEAYGFFNVGLTILLIGIMPSLIITVVFIIINALSDRKINKCIERGIPIR